MRVNEHTDAISLSGGEADEERRLKLDLDTVLSAMRRLVTGAHPPDLGDLRLWLVHLVAPIVVAAPGYFGGKLTFGGLMMVVGAFNQVQSSLRWFVDNFGAIADWRATLLRVASFRRAVLTTDVLHNVGSRIEFFDTESATRSTSRTSSRLAHRLHLMSERDVSIKRGERVVIIGENGSRQDAVFPRDRRPLAVGQRAHRPAEGRGRHLHAAHALSSRRRAARGPRLSLRSVEVPGCRLHRCARPCRSGAPRSGPRHAEALGPRAERRRAAAVAFARVFLHKPPWLVIDEVLEFDRRHALMSASSDLLTKDLDKTGVIHIERSEPHDPMFKRVLHLVKEADGRQGDEPDERSPALPARIGKQTS